MSISSFIAKRVAIAQKNIKAIPEKAAEKNAIGRAKAETMKDMNKAERFLYDLLEYDKDGFPVAMSKKGKYAVLGLSGALAANNAYDENTRQQMGSTDGQIYSNTPNYQAYTKMKPQRNPFDTPGGADGSLVFALDKTKHGGFL